MLEGNGHEIRRRVYSPDGVCPTLCGLGAGGNTEPKIIVQCAAMRGRYNSDGKIEQQLELGSSDHTNALTTVSKDNYIIEKRKKY